MKHKWLNPRWLLISTIAVVSILWIISLTPLVGDGYDDTRYIALSQAIAEGQGFCRPPIPGCQPETKFPVGYPLLLTPVWMVWPDFPQNVVGFKLISVLGGMLVISLSYILLSRYDYLSKQEAILIAALTAFAPQLFVFATRAFSETIYAAFSILSVIALERYGQGTDNDWKRWLLAVLSSAFAFYVRSVGLAIVGAGLIYFVSKKKYGQAWRFGAAFAICVLPWFLRSTWLDVGQSSYLDQLLTEQVERGDLGYIGLAGLLIRVVQNVRAYILAGLPGALFPSQVPLAHVNLPAEIQVSAPWPGVDIAVGTLIVTGWLGHLLLQRRLLDFYLLCYLGICLVWPWEPLRLSIPLIPFLFYYLWFEGRIMALAMSRRWPRVKSYGRRIVIGLVVLWLSASGFCQARFAYHRHSDPYFGLRPAEIKRWQGLYDLFAWIESNVQPNEVMASMNDDRLHLYTDRHATRGLTCESIRQDRVDYVVHIPYGGVMVKGDLSWHSIEPMVRTSSRAFREVYTDPAAGIRVFEVNRPAHEDECQSVAGSQSKAQRI